MKLKQMPKSNIIANVIKTAAITLKVTRTSNQVKQSLET